MRAVTAYDRGASACRRGKKTADNPFTHETAKQSFNFRDWLRGFADQARKEADEMAKDHTK